MRVPEITGNMVPVGAALDVADVALLDPVINAEDESPLEELDVGTTIKTKVRV